MATQVLSDVSGVIPIDIHKSVARQMNRKATSLALFNKKPGSGISLTWGVRFSRATDPATFTEGSDMAAGEFQTDSDVLATLPWGYYRTGFKLSTLVVNAAMSASNAPDAIGEQFKGHLIDATTAIAQQVNKDIFAGAGTAGLISGLIGGGAIDSSGSYAGINSATYSEWASTELTNGTNRELTKELLDECERKIYDAHGEGPAAILASSAVCQKYEKLFDQNVRFVNGGSNDLSVARPNNGTGHTGYTYKGIPVYRDRNATANSLFMLNLDEIEVCVLPEMDPGMQTTPDKLVKQLTDSDGNLLGIPVSVRALAMLGDAYSFEASVHLQLKVRSRKAHGVIKDIAA